MREPEATRGEESVAGGPGTAASARGEGLAKSRGPDAATAAARGEESVAGGPGAAAAARGHALAEATLTGDRRALARLLTAVESRTGVGEAALRRLHPAAGRAHLVGITGPPGAGKSTLVAALIAELRRRGRSVAVVAVDPSSPITGGALLGDRVRMQVHAGDDRVFIRSMAARGHAGGLAASSVVAATVLDAAGFEVILLETVGTGQSEVEVAAAADTTVVLEAPEMGDEVQAIKAGLLEVADIVVVNKGDRPGAQRTAAELRAMLTATSSPRLTGEAPSSPAAGARTWAGEARRPAGDTAQAPPERPRPKRPDVLVTTALTGDGVPELLDAIERHRAGLAADQRPAAQRARSAALVWALVADRVRALLGDAARAGSTEATFEAVALHELDPYAAADNLVAALVGGSVPDVADPAEWE